jgi:AraC-like DNA-binding protein
MMNNRFRVSGSLERRLRDVGLSPGAVLAQAGLPLGLFNGGKILLTTEEFFALYRGIADASADPAVGLKLGTENRVELYDPIKIAALSTRSLRSAIERLSRYKQLTCPEKIDLVERGNESAVRFSWLLAEQDEPDVLVDVCFSWIASIAERGADRQVRPRRVELQRPEAFRSIYEKHFECPVKFNAARNALVFSRADADVPFLTYNPDLLAAIAPQLEAELTQQMAAKDLREQVKGILKGLIAGQRPGIHDVARELRVSARTLQRCLAADGATFQLLTEEARRELAHHYLLHSALELNETAYLLGYEDANSFFRAFHKWEGTSPGQWKSSHANPS